MGGTFSRTSAAGGVTTSFWAKAGVAARSAAERQARSLMIGWMSGCGGDGPGAIGNPFAPRSGVQAAGRESRQLHGESIVACGHAGAAHVHGALRVLPEKRLVFGAKLLGRLEASVGIQVLLPEAVDGSGDVAGHGV